MWVLYLLCLVFGLSRGDLGKPRFPAPVAEQIPALHISTDDIHKAFSYAQNQLRNKIDIENKYIDQGNAIPATELSSEIRAIGLVNPKTVELNNNEGQFEEAAKWLSNRYSLTQDETRLGLHNITLPDDVPAAQECKSLREVGPCDENSKYRTADGTCNNLLKTSLGKAFSCNNRVMKLTYSDGLSSPRLAEDGKELPNTRILSRIIGDDLNITTNSTTQMAVSFAHFLSHDITLTVSSLAGDSGSNLKCCPNKSTTAVMPSMCYPLSITEDDPDFSPDHRTCMSLVRAAACNEDCKLGSPRRHVNQHTSFIDASHVYGVSINETMVLRTGEGGALRNQILESDELPMASLHPDVDQCSKALDNNQRCIQTGDYRSVQQPGLTTMHIIFFREHNRIAKIIASDYPHLTDEELFQETRRIIGAEIQVVAYKELLPVLIGPELMDFFKLKVLEDGYSTYDPTVDPRAFSEYSTSAARFGHTLVARWYNEANKDGTKQGAIDLVTNNFRIPCFLDGQTDSIARGLYMQWPQAFDRHFTAVMTNGGLPAPGKRDGLDHVAFNVQRGREVGLPSYTEVMKFCYNISFETFDDLKQTMPLENIPKFQNVYSNVNDIDLYIGGFAETPNTNSVQGPCFACLTGLQFHNVKYGDRYFFEHGSQTGSFTKGQLEVLRNVTMAKIFSQNSRGEKIQPSVFRVVSPENALTDSRYQTVDFKNWMDK